MALWRSIAKRLIKHQTPAIGEHSPFSYLSSQRALSTTKPYFHRQLLTPSPCFRRFLQQASTMFSVPISERLRERFNTCNVEERLSLKNPPVSVNDARKILRFCQLENVRSALKQIPKSSISYSEFVAVCIDACSNDEQGLECSKILDHAGDVIVLGNDVFLRPDQLAKSMENLISQSIAIPKDPRKQQLEEFERQKSFIDKKSLSQVRGELYCGLGFLIIQTLAFIRLTFWELSWDVMEPICFFVTSFHFALAYMFFIKTSKEPTFEGYSQRRFKTKQRKLMEVYNFDLQKYNELCAIFYPTHQNWVSGISGF